jgi:1-acyl-sn-glycerol-3-phosphate acyltransferase
MTSADLPALREPATPVSAPPAHPVWQPPRIWRFLLWLSRYVVPAFCRLRISGEIPAELRGRPYILACNHVGTFDPIALTGAFAKLGVAPRILATGGLFRAPFVGRVLARCGHLRVDRGRTNVVDALDTAAAAIADGAVIAGYPEGRITLDPGLWPERARTGMARLALITRAPVIPVSIWGAHEVVAYHGFGAMAWRLLVSAVRRPVVHVRFGAPVELSDLSVDQPRHPLHASNRIIAAITDGLRPLRADEPGLPRYVDLTRPVSTARTLARGVIAGVPQVRQDRLSGGTHPERLSGLGDPAVGRTE